MLKFFFPLLITTLLVLPLYNEAQILHRDDKSTIADSIRVNDMITKVIRFQDTSTKSSLPIIKQLRQLSTSLDAKRGIVYAEYLECRYNWLSGNYTLAMKIGLQALADAEKWKINDALPQVYSVMANLHKETGNYPMAFTNNTKGLNAARANADTVEIIGFLSQQAMFTHSYFAKKHQLQNDNSLQLKLEALKMAESQPKYEQERIPIYDNLAQYYKEQKDYTQALFYGNKGAELAKKYNKLRSLTYSYCWLGESYYYMGQHDKGIAYINNALVIAKQLKYPFREMELNQAMYPMPINQPAIINRL